MTLPESPVTTEQLINVGDCLLNTQIVDGYHHAECDVCGCDTQLPTLTANAKKKIEQRRSERCKRIYRSGVRMGIDPEATEGHRFEYDILNSDGLDADVQMRDVEEGPDDVDMVDSLQRSGTVTQDSIQYRKLGVW
jgi:hypothetical protein